MNYVNTNDYIASSSSKTGSSTGSVNSKAGESTLDTNDFLKLLAAQLSNQDVSNPTDNTLFVSQMAQFSSLQAMQNMQIASDKQYASSLVGKKVFISTTNSEGQTATDEGLVNNVVFSSSGNTVQVNGYTYKVSDITQVINNVSTGKYFSSAGGATIYLGTSGKSITDYSIGIQYKTSAADTSKTVGIVADTGKKQITITLDATGGTDKLPTMTDLQNVLQGTWTWQQTTDGTVTSATAPADFDSKIMFVDQTSFADTKNKIVHESSSSPIKELDP